MPMNEEILQQILDKHNDWYECRDDGVCADLHDADLENGNVPDVDLQGAQLSEADMRWVNLQSANMAGADLSGADLRWANMDACFCDNVRFEGANIYGAQISAHNREKALSLGAIENETLFGNKRRRDCSEFILASYSLHSVNVQENKK
jgi:uncharacterized protein YjbI with pentapeptide repeats